MRKVSCLLLVATIAAQTSCESDATSPDEKEPVTRTAGSPGIDTYAKDFGWVTAVDADDAGNLYVADGARNEIYRISVVDRSKLKVAGSYSADPLYLFDGDGGPATTAHLSIPIGFKVHTNGDIYIADVGNNVIRKVDGATGIISSITGVRQGYDGDHGPAINASFFAPQDVTVGFNGDVYIADTQNNVIRKITTATGIVTTIAGNGQAGYSGDDGPATSAMLNNPTGIALDNVGNIFVAEPANSIVRRIDINTGIISTVCGIAGTTSFTGDGDQAKRATLMSPNKLSVDAEGNLLIADTGNSRIRKVDMSTGIINTIAGNGKYGYAGDGGDAVAATLGAPSSVCADRDGNIFIADPYDSRIRVVTP